MHDDGPAVRLPADGPHGKLCVQFAPLDTVLVSSSQDGSLNIWDVATCQAKDSYRMLHQVWADMFAPTDMVLSCLQMPVQRDGHAFIMPGGGSHLCPHPWQIVSWLEYIQARQCTPIYGKHQMPPQLKLPIGTSSLCMPTTSWHQASVNLELTAVSKTIYRRRSISTYVIAGCCKLSQLPNSVTCTGVSRIG